MNRNAYYKKWRCEHQGHVKAYEAVRRAKPERKEYMKAFRKKKTTNKCPVNAEAEQ